MDALLLPVAEAAKVIGISRARLFQLIAADDIESVKLGGKRMIPAEALHDFVARLRTKTAA